MDGNHFDAIARSLASTHTPSRRQLLKGLVAGLAGGLFGGSGAQSVQRAPRQDNGVACARASDCASLRCVDGVCCDSACTGQCESCATGACQPVAGAPVGNRPACPGSGPCAATCDGVTGKSCTAWPGGDTACGAATCADGWLTTYSCGGNGACVPTTTNCALYGCDASGSACATGCTSHDQCPGSSYCAADGRCIGDQPLGAACSDAAACQTGYCADGVCCIEACDGTCRACNLPGSEGFCTEIPDGGACDGGACCDGECVDTSSNLEHCGRCDNACQGATCQRPVCNGGVCDTTPLDSGTPCDDGDACTHIDTCQQGACVGGDPVACPPTDQCHDPGVCDPLTGACDNEKPDGTECDDGNACTRFDTCRDGECVGGNPLICNPLLLCNRLVGCDPATGDCVYEPADEGESCGSSPSACQDLVCRSGDCVPEVRPGFCAIDGACHSAGSRNPANTCQICDPNQTPEAWTNAPAGSACADDARCDGDEACDGAGACLPGFPVSCPPPQPCQEAGVCDPESGSCTYALKGAGSVCRAATSGCELDATCTGDRPDCPPNPITVGAACDTGDLCTPGGVCQADGTCAGTETVCEQLDDCHDAGVCDPLTGRCTNPSKPDGAVCNDGAACTTSGACQAGVCTGITRVDCATDNPCLTAVCDADIGCTTVPKPAGTVCGDGCADNLACDGEGACVAGTPTACDQCTACDSESGTCVPANDGQSCAAEHNCGLDWRCSGGACVPNTPVVCPESPDACRARGVCDPATSACTNPDAPDGAECNDGNACTRFDTCQAGVCTGLFLNSCDLVLDSCTTGGHCDPAIGACVGREPVPNGTSCSGALTNLCTGRVECLDGICTAFPKECPGGSGPCQIGGCDILTGNCTGQAANLPDGVACEVETDDCGTFTGVCRAGACDFGCPAEHPNLCMTYGPGRFLLTPCSACASISLPAGTLCGEPGLGICVSTSLGLGLCQCAVGGFPCGGECLLPGARCCDEEVCPEGSVCGPDGSGCVFDCPPENICGGRCHDVPQQDCGSGPIVRCVPVGLTCCGPDEVCGIDQCCGQDGEFFFCGVFDPFVGCRRS